MVIMLVIPDLGRWRQKIRSSRSYSATEELEASLSYVRPCYKTKPNKRLDGTVAL